MTNWFIRPGKKGPSAHTFVVPVSERTVLFDLSSITYSAQVAVSSAWTGPRSHILEILAELLGYRTYSALTLDRRSAGKNWLETAELVCLQIDESRQRAAALGFGDEAIATLLDTFVKEIRKQIEASQAKITVYTSERDLLDDQQSGGDLYGRLVDCDEILSELANLNVDDFDLDVEELEPELPLMASKGVWRLTGTGTVKGQQLQDRVFYGDTIDVEITSYYTIVGRVGLIHEEDEIDARVRRGRR